MCILPLARSLSYVTVTSPCLTRPSSIRREKPRARSSRSATPTGLLASISSARLAFGLRPRFRGCVAILMIQALALPKAHSTKGCWGSTRPWLQIPRRNPTRATEAVFRAVRTSRQAKPRPLCRAAQQGPGSGHVRRLDFTSRSKPTPAAAAAFLGRKPLLVFGRTRGPSPRGQTFERSPADVRNPDDCKLDLRVALLHSLNSYHREFAANEIGDRLKLESDGKQSIHVAAMRRTC